MYSLIQLIKTRHYNTIMEYDYCELNKLPIGKH